MRVARGSAIYCVVAGVLILCLWTVLIAGGRLDDVSARATSYAFHLMAEGLTAAALIIAGIDALRGAPRARRLFCFAAGMLLIAAMGMIVVYVSDGFLPFIALGGLVFGLTLLFFLRNQPARVDLVFLALGTVLYVELNALGNLLQRGDAITAAYVGIAMVVTVPVTLMVLLRGL